MLPFIFVTSRVWGKFTRDETRKSYHGISQMEEEFSFDMPEAGNSMNSSNALGAFRCSVDDNAAGIRNFEKVVSTAPTR